MRMQNEENGSRFATSDARARSRARIPGSEKPGTGTGAGTGTVVRRFCPWKFRKSECECRMKKTGAGRHEQCRDLTPLTF